MCLESYFITQIYDILCVHHSLWFSLFECYMNSLVLMEYSVCLYTVHSNNNMALMQQRS